MATLVSVSKEEGLLSFLYDDGSILKRTIRYDDTMISHPPPGYEEIGNCYVNSSGKLVINYNGTSMTIDPTAGVGLTATQIRDALLSLPAAERGFVTTDPSIGDFKVISITRKANGETEIKYSNVPEA